MRTPSKETWRGNKYPAVILTFIINETLDKIQNIVVLFFSQKSLEEETSMYRIPFFLDMLELLILHDLH